MRRLVGDRWGVGSNTTGSSGSYQDNRTTRDGRLEIAERISFEAPPSLLSRSSRSSRWNQQMNGASEPGQYGEWKAVPSPAQALKPSGPQDLRTSRPQDLRTPGTQDPQAPKPLYPYALSGQDPSPRTQDFHHLSELGSVSLSAVSSAGAGSGLRRSSGTRKGSGGSLM